jgi:hypothetical protein
MTTQNKALTRFAKTAEKLKAKGVRVAPKAGWKKSFGLMKDSEVHLQAVKAGARWRQKLNQVD